MPLAGEKIVVGRVPGERIATEIVTSNSATFTTTRVDIASITASLVIGRTYRVTAMTRWVSTAVDDVIAARIWEDSSSGTELASANVLIGSASSLGWMANFDVEFTASATGDQVFVLDAVATTGTANLEAASNRPTYLYVDYIRG